MPATIRCPYVPCTLLAIGLVTASMGCRGHGTRSPPEDETATAPASKAPREVPAGFPDGRTLLLPQAQFTWEIGPGGKRRPVPGPARLLMLKPGGTAWQRSMLEDPESRVFHKAACVETPEGRRLLTIGGTEAVAKLWSITGDGWRAETLWKGHFGGKWDRLRDFELGDVDGDGKREIVLATHDQGVVAILHRGPSGWRAEEIDRRPDTFVHEIELGDLDGDGRIEIFATPSHPNKADRSQPGQIVRYVRTKDGFVREVVADLRESHAKEILVTDLDGDGRDELYAAIEAPTGTVGKEGAVQIRRYEPRARGSWRSRVLVALPGAVQSRVLLPVDLRGRGARSIVVTTMKAGVWEITPLKGLDGPWGKERIDGRSGGFEHAAGVADLDGDGRNELYVVSDDDDEVRRYLWDGERYRRTVIATIERSDITWNLLPCTPVPL